MIQNNFITIDETFTYQLLQPHSLLFLEVCLLIQVWIGSFSRKLRVTFEVQADMHKKRKNKTIWKDNNKIGT